MFSTSKCHKATPQLGLSLVELIVTMAILGIVVAIGVSLFSYPTVSRGKNLTQIKLQENYAQAFNLFYRTYNQTYTQNGNNLNYVATIESATSPVQIQFNSTNVNPTLVNNIFTIGNGDVSLNNLLNYYPVPQPNESSGMCQITGTPSSNNTWTYRCPSSATDGIQSTFAVPNIKKLPIVFIDGLVCIISALPQGSGLSITIDPSFNNCTSSQLSSEVTAISGFFTLPRLLVYSADNTFIQPIFDSFTSPRTRFGTNNNYYPTSY
jgi:prepilin-type N-terminal cleavage/methylation domain-containing protein